MSTPANPRRTKKVNLKGEMVKIRKKGQELCDVKKMVLVLHILTDCNLGLKLKKFDTGVS